MKKLLIGLLTLTSISAFAFHPGDNESLYNIGTKTKLTILRDINIIPNKNVISLGENCFLRLKERKNFDRVLAAGSVLTIVKTDYAYLDGHLLFVDNVNIHDIKCKFKHTHYFTIGDFKADTRGTIEVKLADPTRI